MTGALFGEASDEVTMTAARFYITQKVRSAKNFVHL